MRPSTATTTAAWRSRRRPAPSLRRGRGSGRWRYRRTTTSGPRLTAASARWSTRRTVRPGGVSPPSTPLFTSPTSSIHQQTRTHSNKHCWFSHTLTPFSLHTRCVSRNVNVVSLIRLPQFPALCIPSLKRFVTSQQHNTINMQHNQLPRLNELTSQLCKSY